MPCLKDYTAEKTFKQLLQTVISLYPHPPIAGMSEWICFANGPVLGTYEAS